MLHLQMQMFSTGDIFLSFHLWLVLNSHSDEVQG